MAASGKGLPKDAQVMAAILKDMGVNEYEPRVIHQMLDFVYCYVTEIMEEARCYSSHANKKSVDVEDLKLAVQLRMDSSCTTPPPRELLMDIARSRNSQPLPLIKPYTGPKLPPDRYCLSATNYRLRSLKKQQTGAMGQRIQTTVSVAGGVSALQPATARLVSQQTPGTVAVGPRINLTPGTPVVQVVSAPRAATGMAGSGAAARAATVSVQPSTGAAPTVQAFRFVSGSSAAAAATVQPAPSAAVVTPAVTEAAGVPAASLSTSSAVVAKSEVPPAVDDAPPAAKRKREDVCDEDYDM